jgi:putative ABC transport system permease protein
MGILRAIGARPRAVWLIVVGEGIVVAAMSWALGVLAAWPIGKGVGDFLVAWLFKTGLDFRFEPKGLLAWLGISLALGAAASFLPAWHAARSSVREAIGYE